MAHQVIQKIVEGEGSVGLPNGLQTPPNNDLKFRLELLR